MRVVLRQILLFALIAIAAVSGTLVAARAYFGPFRFLVQINSPINLQSILGVSTALALLCRMKKDDASSHTRATSAWADALSVVAIVSISLAAFWKTLTYSFLSDDFYLVRLATSTHEYSAPLFKNGGGTEFFRPLGGLFPVVTAWWAGADPFLWHLASLLVHAANAVLLFLLISRLFSSHTAALFASVLFVIHGTRPEAVMWAAGRFDVTSGFFVLAGLLLFHQHLRTDRWSSLCYAGSLLAMAAGILTKESAYVFPVLLMLNLVADPRTSSRALKQSVPFWALAVVLFLIRTWALGGIGGYTDRQTGASEAFSLGVLPVIRALTLRIWSAFSFPVNWSVAPSRGLAVAAALSVAVIVWMLCSAAVERRRLLFSIAFALVAALPAIHQLPIGVDLQKSRLLYLPSAGFCAMLGFAVDALRPVKASLPAALVLLAFNWAALRHNEEIWHQVSSAADNTCSRIFAQMTPSTTRIVVQDLPASLDGVYFLRNGLGSCLDLKANRWLDLTIADAEGDVPAASPSTLTFIWIDAEQSVRAASDLKSN